MRHQQQSGWVLITVAIVLTIAALSAAASLAIMHSRAQSAARAAAVHAEARDLSAMAEAVQQVLDWDATLWAAGSTHSLSFAQVQAAGLPATVATHGGQVGVNPWWQPYTVIAKKDANGDVRAIILDNGPPNAAMMQRAGIHDGQWLAVKQQVATTITQLGGTAAVLDKSGHIATGAAGAFSVDLSTWVSAPPHASAVALVGFGDLEPASTRHDGSPPGPIKRGVCTIAHATVSGAGVCPAGKTQVAQFPHCGKLNQDPQSTTYVSYATDYGPLVLSQRVTKAWTSISQRCHVNFQGFIICPSHPVLSCGRNPNCYMPPHYHQFLSVVSTALVVKLNAATIDEQAACEKDTWALYDKNDTCTLGNTVWWDPAPPPRGEHRCALGPHFSQITGNDRLCCSQ